MSWMKAYPQDHDPFYSFIIVNHVISKMPESSQMERRLCEMLASKALATAAADTPKRKKHEVCL